MIGLTTYKFKPGEKSPAQLFKDMDKLFTWEQWRMIFATSLSPVLAYLTPNGGII